MIEKPFEGFSGINHYFIAEEIDRYHEISLAELLNTYLIKTFSFAY